MAEEEKKEDEVIDAEVVDAEVVEDNKEDNVLALRIVDLESEKSELEKKNKELEETIKTLKDDNLRRAADTENYKKRLRQDKENAVKFANESLIMDLLDPLDNFSRALSSAKENSDFEVMKKGVEMVNDQILSCLKEKWGLEKIDAKEGTPYDPNTMEAYGINEKEGIEGEVVGSECATGWLLRGKVIRSAKVFVLKGVENKEKD